MESILTSIKKLLGIDETYEHFDPDIIMCINSALTVLTQLGVGPTRGFSIQDAEATWSDFLPENSNAFESVKTFIHLKVKLMFDSKSMNSTEIECTNNILRELEWRLNVSAETKIKE